MKKRIKNIIIFSFVLSMFLFAGCGKIDITLTDNGRSERIETKSMTVEKFLEENNIKLNKNDKISPALNTKIEPGDEIVITRIVTKNIKRTKKIAFESETEYSDQLAKGTEEVKRKGKNGQVQITYRYRYVNGYLKKRKIVSKKVIKKPVNEIILIGTKEEPKPEPSSGSSKSGGKTVVSKQQVFDCDGSGHGYYVITYSDGSVSYQDF